MGERDESTWNWCFKLTLKNGNNHGRNTRLYVLIGFGIAKGERTRVEINVNACNNEQRFGCTLVAFVFRTGMISDAVSHYR